MLDGPHPSARQQLLGRGHARCGERRPRWDTSFTAQYETGDESALPRRYHMIDRERPRLVAVVSDLDGTALRSDGALSPLTVSVFASARRRNVPVVIATARTPRAVRNIVGYDQLGVVVCANGAIVWDAGSDVVIDEYS